MENRISEADRIALAELAVRDRAAYAELVTEYVDPVYLTLDLASTFMPTQEMKFGEMLRRQFKGKYHVQQIVPGQITLGGQITVRDQALSYNLDILSAKASYNTLETLHGGPSFTPDAVRSDVQAALAEKVIMRGWNALANIWTAGNSVALTIPGAANSNFLDASGPLTATLLDAAIDHVNYWSGKVRTIIGTEVALGPLTEFGQYKTFGSTPDIKYFTTNGQPTDSFQRVSPYGGGPYGVESYRGVTNIVRLPQIFDETVFPKRPLLPNDYVLVIGEDVGKFITYGGPQYKEYIDNEPTPPYWNYETWLQFGMMVWNAMGIVKIAVSNTIP